MGATLSCLGPGGAQDSFPSDRQSVARELLGLARAGNYHRIKVCSYVHVWRCASE